MLISEIETNWMLKQFDKRRNDSWCQIATHGGNRYSKHPLPAFNQFRHAAKLSHLNHIDLLQADRKQKPSDLCVILKTTSNHFISLNKLLLLK